MVENKGFHRIRGSESATNENPDSNVFKAGAKGNKQEYGFSGTEIFGGIFSEEYLQKLQGIPGAKEFDKMRRSEAQVAMLMSAIKNPIKSANWDIVSADNNDPKQNEIAEFVKAVLFEQLDFDTFKHEALTLIEFGFVVFEVVHNVILNHPRFGTRTGLAGLKFRSQKTISNWNLDKKTGALLNVEQQILSEVGKDCKIPGEFLLVMSQQKEGDNYEGISSLRPIYGAWIRKNLYLKLIAIGLEKYAIGTPVGTTPKTVGFATPEFEQFKEMLRSYTSNEHAFMILPEGYQIKLEFGSFDAEKVKSIILMENSEMVNAFVANFLALGMNGSGGAFALGTDLSDFFLSGIKQYADLICGPANRKLIPDLVKLNYGEQAKYPTMKVTGINDKAGKEFADIVTLLIEKNAMKADDPLEEFLRKQYNLPKADPTTARAGVNVGVTAAVNPNLPATEAGSPTDANKVDVQKLSLNGAQVSSLLSIVQSVAAGLMPRDSAIAMIEAAFNMTTEQANEILGSVGNGFKADPQAVANLPAPKLSEAMTLDEAYVKAFDKKKSLIKNVMASNLKSIYEDLTSQLKDKWAKASPDARITIPLEVKADASKYQAALQRALAEIAATSYADAKTMTGQIKLSERLQLAAAGGFFGQLPEAVKNLVIQQAGLISKTQADNIEKAVTFQFGSSLNATDSLDQILSDIDEKIAPVLDGSTASGISIDAAASNAIATVHNQAQMDWFFEPEVMDEIESFTFVNEDPVSEICQALAGTTFAANDPAVDTYGPPLHHNCKSRLVPNMRGDKSNPQIDGVQAIKDLTDSEKKAITLHECTECDYKLFSI